MHKSGFLPNWKHTFHDSADLFVQINTEKYIKYTCWYLYIHIAKYLPRKSAFMIWLDHKVLTNSTKQFSFNFYRLLTVSVLPPLPIIHPPSFLINLFWEYLHICKMFVNFFFATELTYLYYLQLSSYHVINSEKINCLHR